MTSPNKPPPGRVQVELPAGLDPVYVNFALITHSPSEIIIDCAQLMPQVMQAKMPDASSLADQLFRGWSPEPPPSE